MYVDLDMNGNELQNAVIQNVSSLEGTWKRGQVVFYTVDNTFRIYNGTSFETVTAGGNLPAASETSPLMDGVTSAIQGQLDARVKRYASTISCDGTTASWTLTHGLGARPVVNIYDSNGKEVITQLAELTVTATQIVVTVNTAPANGEQFYVVAVA